MADDLPPDWPKIVERHAERVFRISYRILGSVHDAEDVSQLVFIEARNVQEAGPIQSWTGHFARLAWWKDGKRIRVLRADLLIVDADQPPVNE